MTETDPGTDRAGGAPCGTGRATHPFVAPLTRDTLARHDQPPGRDFDARLSAAMLYADARGFSQLCARLVNEDHRGAEEVGRRVNAHFRRMIDLAEAHGGRVTSIAGDAMVALWPVEPATPAEAVAGASACAMAIAGDTGAGTDATLPVHPVVDFGEARVFHVGGHEGRWAVFAGGPLLDGLPRLAGFRDRRGVVATERARACLDGTARTRHVAPGCHLLQSAPPAPVPRDSTRAALPADMSLDGYLCAAARTLAEAGDTEWIGEFRRVTALFGRFAGLDSSAADALDRLDRLKRDVQRAVGDYGGEILQFMIDDKGLILLAVWGLPTNTSERDADRAVRAAVDIRARAGKSGIVAAAGLRTGTVFAGVVGAPAFLQYSVFGAPINGAAWLMQQTPDDILCDAATRAAADGYAFDAQDTLVPKGQTTPIAVYRPRGPRQRARDTGSGSFGREAERARLRAALAQDAGLTIWVHGEPGMGKSHLADDALRDSAGRTRPHLALQADSILRNRSYGTWLPGIEMLAGVSPDMSATARRDRLRDRLAGLPDLDARLPLVAEDLGLDLPDSPLTAGLSRIRRADQTVDLLGEMVAHLLADGPALVMVDDAHWMDTGSWLVLWNLRKRRADLKLLVLTRPLAFSGLPPEAARLLRDPGVLALPLAELDLAGTEALLCNVLGARDVPRALTHRVFERADGHPYYTKELAASLVLSGTVRVEAGHCHIASGRGDVSNFAFPENIEAAIATRLSDLSPAAQLTLKVASIEGQIFSPDHVAAVRPGNAPRGEIAAHLDAAAARHLVEPDDTRPGMMRFRHSLIVETLYNLLLRDQRRDLHARSARVQESTGAVEPGKSVLLARHWEHGGQVDRAVSYLARAAAEAETAQRPIEAARFLTRALDLNATCDRPAGPDKTGDWNRRAGNALQMLGEVRRSIRYMERALTDLTGVASLRRGNLVFRIVGEFVALKTRRMNAPQPEARRRPLLQAADSCGRLAFQYYEIQQILRSIGYTLLMVNLGKTAGGDSAPLAQGNANLAIAAFQLPRLLDQGRHRRYALQMRERLDDPACDYWVSFIIGILDTGCARLDSAAELLDRARVLSEEHLGRLEWDTAVASLANMRRPQGRFHEAVTLDLQVLDSARERGVNLQQMWALHGLCRSYMALGDMAALDDAARRLRALVTDPDNDADSAISNNLSLLVADGVFAMNDARIDAAPAPLARAADLLGAVDEPQVYLEDAPGYIADAILRCHLLGGRGMARAARACHRGAKRLARLYPVARPKALLLAGDRAFIAGRPARAAHHWARSARIAHDLGLALMEAHAEARLALPGCGPAGTRRLARSRAEAICSDRLDLPLLDPWQRLLAAAGETAL